MNKNVAIAIVLTGFMAFGIASWEAGGATPITPLHVVYPRFNVYAPPACEKLLDEQFPNVKGDVTVPLDVYMRFRQELTACGGHLEEVK